MIPGPFEAFIAVDWSGAKSGYQKKLTVARCTKGTQAPELIAPEAGWSRQGIADFIAAQSAGTLTGFDFSFAPPFLDRGSYLPGENVPGEGLAFWHLVEDVCVADADCGAQSFVEKAYRHHFYLGKADGTKSDYMRWRTCETVFNARGGGKAACVFDAIGAAQVSKASFAGMRVLHRLAKEVPIWPFMTPQPGASAVVEIYCRAFIRLSGLRGLKIRDIDTLNAALAAFDSEPVEYADPLSDDETDVLVTAAGLRALTENPAAWSPEGLSAKVAKTEGWTFGVF
ncbi:MAG: hypothetical protein AAGA36_04535 [Pseudomonadota bacterium]